MDKKTLTYEKNDKSLGLGKLFIVIFFFKKQTYINNQTKTN